MALHTLFGINGVGKDTVAESLRAKDRDLVVTSMSRLSMYLLGIIDDYDVRTKVSEDHYSRLEQTPQSTMVELEKNEFRQELEQIADTDGRVMFLGHLVSALRNGEKIEYLTNRKTPTWLTDISDSLIQLKAPAVLISERRTNEKERNRSVDISQIDEHQSLCDDEWCRIGESNVLYVQKMHIVNNIDLSETVNEVSNVIYK